MKTSDSPKNCFVTGATGVVGVPLVEELVRRGHQVSVLVRGEINANLFPPSVKIFRGDLRDESVLAEASAGAEFIFHLAAKLHVPNPDEKLRREFYETNVEATRNLLRLAAANNAEKFVFFSTVNVYGTGDGAEIFTEESPLKPHGIYAETKAEAEREVLAAVNRKGAKIGVALRLAAIYGSRMKGNYVTLLDALDRRRFFFVGKGENRRAVVHQRDAARAAIVAAEKAAGGTIYNITDGGVPTFYEIVNAMSRALGQTPPKLHLPEKFVRFGIGTAENAAKIFSIKPPVSRNMLDKLLEDIAVSGEKFRKEMHFEPQFDLDAGWRETIAEVRSN